MHAQNQTDQASGGQRRQLVVSKERADRAESDLSINSRLGANLPPEQFVFLIKTNRERRLETCPTKMEKAPKAKDCVMDTAAGKGKARISPLARRKVRRKAAVDTQTSPTGP
jgi:hypothetical protein